MSSDQAAAGSSMEKVFWVTAALIREGPARMDSSTMAEIALIEEELLLPSEQGHVLMTQKARMFPRGNLPCQILAPQPGLRELFHPRRCDKGGGLSRKSIQAHESSVLWEQVTSHPCQGLSPASLTLPTA